MIGQVLGKRYRLVKELGAGGMGAVYEAEQLDLKRRVAVKVMREGVDEGTIDRFRQEAEALARLDHTNIVRVIDFGIDDEQNAFLVMEILRGAPLSKIIRDKKKLPVERAVPIVAQVLSALVAAHAEGIVHRDIKPENIFVCSDSSLFEIAKVLDFGLAKVLDENARAHTRHGVVLGTPAYMAPEQLRGAAADPKTDIFATGITLYYALSGRRPFEGPTTSAVVYAIAKQPALPLSALEPELDIDLVRVVEKSIAKDAKERFGSATEMLAALEPWTKPKRMDASAPKLPSTRDETTRARKRSRDPVKVITPPLGSAMVADATFDARGESAFAIGPAGLAKWDGTSWSARPLPDGLAPKRVSLSPGGDLLLLGKRSMIRKKDGYHPVTLPTDLEIEAGVVTESGFVLAGTRGDVACIVRGSSVTEVAQRLRLRDVTLSGSEVYACGDRGMLVAVREDGTVRPRAEGGDAFLRIAVDPSKAIFLLRGDRSFYLVADPSAKLEPLPEHVLTAAVRGFIPRGDTLRLILTDASVVDVSYM